MSQHEQLISLKHMVAELAGLTMDELKPSEPLFTGGLIDSMSLLQLITFAEKSFGIAIAPGDINVDHWNTLDSMEQFLIGKASSAQPVPCLK